MAVPLATSAHTSSQGENRIIAFVTGANSGFGYALCQTLLDQLSRPPPARVPDTITDPLALAPSLRTSYAALPPAPAPAPAPPVALTLVLAVRRRENGEDARDGLLLEHKQAVELRKIRQEKVVEGWLDSLRIDVEVVELDHVGGDTGVLRFCERVRAKYPYVTSLFLNAGYAAFELINQRKFFATMFRVGFVYALGHCGLYTPETVGEKTADGERGRVWSVNVLSTFLLLAPLLRASPASLPVEPRIVYTSTMEAEAEVLPANVLDDIELLREPNSYRASKYMANLVMCHLDRTLNADAGGSGGAREVRCLIGEPGIGLTNIAARQRGVDSHQIVIDIKLFFNWLFFYLAYLVGSRSHPTALSDNVLPMLYAALVGSARLPPPAKVPAPVTHVCARRFQSTTVRYGEVEEWEGRLGIARKVAERCESVRRDWRRREGME